MQYYLLQIIITEEQWQHLGGSVAKLTTSGRTEQTNGIFDPYQWVSVEETTWDTLGIPPLRSDPVRASSSATGSARTPPIAASAPGAHARDQVAAGWAIRRAVHDSNAHPLATRGAAAPGSGKASGMKPALCWGRSTTGLPRVLTLPTSRKRKRSSTSWPSGS